MDNNDWIKWGGGKCPVDPNSLVQTIFRCEDVEYHDQTACRAGGYYWDHRNSQMDIVAYRVVEPSHG